MKKVVYNSSFGGFGLSGQALVLMHMLGMEMNSAPLHKSGMTENDFPLEGPSGYRAHQSFGMIMKDGVVYDTYDMDESMRSHPVLVKVVEMLGAEANGHSADLAIEELDDDTPYRIDEYDGRESVVALSMDGYVKGYQYTDIPLPASLQLSAEGKVVFTEPKLLPDGDMGSPSM